MRVALSEGMPGLVVQVTPVGVGATDVRPWEVAALVLIVEQERFDEHRPESAGGDFRSYADRKPSSGVVGSGQDCKQHRFGMEAQ